MNMTYRKRGLTLWLLLLAVIFFSLLIRFGLIAYHIQRTVSIMEQSAAPPSGRHIILIAQELDNPFWRTIEAGAREAAESYGMDVEYIGPLRIDPEEQTRLLEKSIAARPDALLVQGVLTPDYIALVDKAVTRGIPVIAVDTDLPGSKRLSYVGTDNLESGKLLGRTVVRMAGEQANIGVIFGSETAENQKLRLRGFQSVIGQFPGLHVVEVRASNISRILAAQQAARILRDHPDTNIFVGLSALDGIGIVQALHNVNPARNIRVFGFDDLPDTLAAIRSGGIAASVIQKPRLMGREAVGLLNDYFAGKPLPDHRYTPIEALDAQSLPQE
jgi:ribose transport system substrate-binding protein